MRSILFCLAALVPSAAWAAPDATGNWLVEGGTAIVAIGPCGPNICGRISRILQREPGWNGADVNNPDPKLRTRPVLGLPILTGFKRAGTGLSGGRIYDPNSGKTVPVQGQPEPGRVAQGVRLHRRLLPCPALDPRPLAPRQCPLGRHQACRTQQFRLSR
jgi:hypothetical protein